MGFAVPPVPIRDEDLAGYIRRRRAALPPWEPADPDWAEDSALWRPRFEMERVNEIGNDNGRYNRRGRLQFWDGKDVDAVLASLGFVPPRRDEPRRLPPPYGEPTGPPA